MRSKILLVFMVLSFFVKPTETFAQVNVQDSLALVDFYDSTDGSHWNSTQWDLSAPISQWDGVGVNGGRVTSLNLSGKFQSGKMPSSFGNLTALQTIYLLDCRFTEATLPESFSKLINLVYIKMSAVFWYLPFPKSITKLPGVTTLDLQDNFFTDTIPASIGNMTELRSLNMSNCFSLNGSKIPSELGNLKNLSVLYLNNSNLSGIIPESIANLDSLSFLDVSFNNLEGVIPTGFNSIWTFRSLAANNNHFTFQAIEPFIQSANAKGKAYDNLQLSPQSNIKINRHHEKLFVSPGGTLADNTFKWYEANTGLVATIPSDSTYTPAGMGKYYVAVTNAIATDLTLNSDTFNYNFFLADTATTITQTITGTDTTYINDGILKIAALKPVEGVNALTGNVSTTVTVDPAVSTFNGQPYVQRHYDISPAINAENAQAIVVLYFTQQDFDNYNNYITAHNLSLPLLPSDGVNNGNMRITQLHGSFSSSPDPGNYDPANSKLITPNVAWNPINGWWVVTFYVNGFSGFFVSTGNSVLPLSLIEFKGEVQGNKVELQWLTVNETGAKEFIIEHSLDGTTFDNIGIIKAASTEERNSYHFTHFNPSEGIQFYRLRMMDIDGQYTYSNVVKINLKDKNESLRIYPNPVTAILNLKINSNKTENTMLKITDALGKSVYQKIISVNAGITSCSVNIEKLPSGVYHLNINLNDRLKQVSFVKK